MTVLQKKQIYIHFDLADLTKRPIIQNIKLDYKDKTDSVLIFRKFLYNTPDNR